MDTYLTELESVLGRVVGNVLSELMALRANRPTAGMVEDIKVEVYGDHLPIKQLGSITILPPREIDISVWDPTVAGPVSEAISASLKINPLVEGTLIRVNLPTLTDERRRELNRVAGRLAEDARIKIRSERDSVNKRIESDAKSGLLSEDAKFSLKDRVQKITGGANSKIEDALSRKLQELSE